VPVLLSVLLLLALMLFMKIKDMSATNVEKAEVLLALGSWSRNDLLALIDVLQIILSDEKVDSKINSK
jgi:hypothetical protein